MKYINILHTTSDNWLLHQIDHNRFDGKYKFFENSSEDRIWDVVVVYESIQSPVRIKCRKGGLIFFSGEPPLSNVYSDTFLGQFDLIVASHRKLHHPNVYVHQQSLPWHFGLSYQSKISKYDFKTLSELPEPQKNNEISVITSSKKMMPGHNRRIELIHFLKQEFPTLIDFYGKDTNPVDDKADAILPYKFHICLENSQIEDYWTEKLADPILGYSIPIYIGCTNIGKYFNTKGMYILSFKDKIKIVSTLKEIQEDPGKAYRSKFEALLENRNILLNQHNFFSQLEDILMHKLNILSVDTESIIRPNNSFGDYTIKLTCLRLKRIMFKLFFNLQ